MRKLTDLRPQSKNANRHTQRGMGVLERSIEQDGWIGAITVAADGETFDGSARVEVGVTKGFEDADVHYGDGSKPLVYVRTDIPTADHPRAKRLGIAANRAAQLNLDYDTDVLADLQTEGVLDGLFSDTELDALLASVVGPEPGNGGDDFDTTPQDGPTRVQRGDVWRIGPHRLMCGDSTSADDVGRLMGGEKAECIFTDPPYNALKSWGKDEAKSETRLDPSVWFKNDNMDWADYGQFLKDAFALFEAPSLYVCCDYRIYPLIVACLEFADYRVKHCIVWKKNLWGLGWRYRFQHEFIVYACKGEAPFYGDRSQSDVWEISVDRDGDHNTPKPIELPARAIRNSAKPKAIVVDYFAGSGPTLIAAHREGRVSLLMELDPHNCDVILRRAEAEGIGPIEKVGW